MKTDEQEWLPFNSFVLHISFSFPFYLPWRFPTDFYYTYNRLRNADNGACTGAHAWAALGDEVAEPRPQKQSFCFDSLSHFVADLLISFILNSI
jgi:hypothetical protein